MSDPRGVREYFACGRNRSCGRAGRCRRVGQLARYGDRVPPPPAAREKVLDAFQRLLIEHGERETTLDAVARAAGVSKGGVIYHFNSREALIEALLARLEVLADEDLALMSAAPDAPV